MERALLAADFGPKLANEIVEGVKRRLELKPRPTTDEAIEAAKAEVESTLQDSKPTETPVYQSSPSCVILMVGVNGAGKTTTVAKLAKKFQKEGHRVLLAAADTFRAAAIEQLKLWGKRLNIEVVAGDYGADPGSVAHQALRRMHEGGFTRLLIDTAGRQHTKSNLMQELEKVKRVVTKNLNQRDLETWLVIDAPTGGNALTQAREFHASMQLTGIVITKLDGTSKGGMVLSIHRETKLPIRFVGLGEGEDDLEPFDAKTFAAALWSQEVSEPIG